MNPNPVIENYEREHERYYRKRPDLIQTGPDSFVFLVMHSCAANRKTYSGAEIETLTEQLRKI